MIPAHGQSPSPLKTNLLSALVLGVSFAFVIIVAIAILGDAEREPLQYQGSNPLSAEAEAAAPQPAKVASARVRLRIPALPPKPQMTIAAPPDKRPEPRLAPAVLQRAATKPNAIAPRFDGIAPVFTSENDVPKVSIIIDDMGHSPRHSAAALKLPRQVAFALLPYARASKTLATRARARGHELIVHIPMQPKSDARNPGPYVLRTDASEQELRDKIAWNLSQFSGFTAVNNHMGSAFTEDEVSMRILFEELSARGLAFYDSRTTASSKAVVLALQYGVSLAERDVFLDNEIEAGAVDEQLERLETLAKRNGSAIAIGHPHKVTFEQLAIWSRTLEAKGLMLVAPSVIMEGRRTPKWRIMVNASPPNKVAQTAF